MKRLSAYHRSSLAVWLTVAVLLLPILYVLSVGPVFWLHKHGYLGYSALAIYGPLSYLYDSCQPVRYAIDWYASLWGL